jgi:hypothetical protein
MSNTLTYKRGVYFSLYITFTFAILLFNALIKRVKIDTKNRYGLFIFVIIITCLGLYSGIYSILNYYFNYSQNQSVEWKIHDKLIGHFSVRITSLILLMSIIRFTFKYVFGNKFIFFLKSLILPSKPTDIESYSLDRTEYNLNSYYSKYYFCQVGFYIVNVMIAEICIVTGDTLNSLAIFFTLLPIMVDDYLAIHYYFQKYGHMSNWHRIKKNIFNLFLFIFSIIPLYSLKMYFVLAGYVLIVLILFILNPKGEKELI